MKKLACTLLALLLLLSLGACKVNTGAETGSGDGDTSSAASVDPADYNDDLTGLASCLTAAGYIEGDPTEMEASFIGAKNGRRYSFSYNNSPVTVEMYEYDEKDAKTADVLKSVDETGSFTILSTQVEAVHAGRYLLIYSDPSDKEINTSRRDAVVELFNRFGG